MMELSQSINLTSTLVSVLILTATFCFKCVIDSHRARLSDIPGPWIARYTNLYAVYLAWRTERGSSKVNILDDLRDTYGDVIRLGPRSVTVFDPFALPVIYGVRSRLNKVDKLNNCIVGRIWNSDANDCESFRVKHIYLSVNPG